MSSSGPAAERESTPGRDAEVATADGLGRSRPSSSLPERVGRYLVLSLLGEGGMGVVLEAFDPELDRRIAIKLLHPLRGGANASRRLLREAQVMARLSHPNVVQVHDAGELGNSVFVAMELVRGRTMRLWLRTTKPHWRDILMHFSDAARGLAAAHDAGIVHRDFKPDNMLLGDDGRVRVADFGLANVELVREPESENPTPRADGSLPITATGAVMGTPMYMAPEQHAGLSVGPAADQFGFCVALHEALFGQRPFAGQRTHEIAESVLSGAYVEPKTVPAELRWLLAITRRGLDVDPRRRFASFHELVAALQRDPAARRRRVRTAVVTGVLLAGAGVFAARGALTEPCSGGAAAFAPVWDADRRAALGPFDADTAALADTLDGYVARWIAAHEGTCVAHHRGELSADGLDRQMACLQRRRAAVARLVGLLDHDSTDRSAASAAALGLPAVGDCSDPDSVDLRIARPTDPQRAAAIEAVRVRLVEAEVVHDAGAIESAVPQLESIATDARALQDPALAAEIALASGRLALDRMDLGVAAERLADAVVLGIEAGLDRVVAEALIRKVFVDASRSTAPIDVLDDARVARAQLARAGAPAPLAALLANNLGVVHGVGGDYELARASFDEAVRLGEHDDANPVDVAGFAINLALHTAEPDTREAIFDRATAMLRERLGPGHLMHLELAARRAETTADLDTALARTQAVCDATDERLRDDAAQRHQCRWRLAELHEEGGDLDAARADLVLALAALDSPVSAADADYLAAQRDKTLGYQAVLADDARAALTALDRARTAFAPHAEAPWIALELADVDRLAARALLASNRDDEARTRLESALAIYVAAEPRRQDRAIRARAAQTRLLLERRR